MKHLRLWKYRLSFDIRELVTGIIGVGSVTEDGYHCLFLDLDSISEEQLTTGILAVQKAYGLSTCYVFRTSKSSYHAIILDKLTRGTAINVIDHFIDSIPSWNANGIINHLISSLRRRYWTLRISARNNDRIAYHKTFKASSSFQKSNGHRKTLNHFYGLKIPRTKNFDEYNNVVFDHYTSKKKIRVKI